MLKTEILADPLTKSTQEDFIQNYGVTMGLMIQIGKLKKLQK